MIISDAVTNANYMSHIGLIVSLSKTSSRPPREVFTGLAHRAARKTSQRLGARVEYADDSLVVMDEHYPVALVLKQFKQALVQLARAELGIL